MATLVRSKRIVYLVSTRDPGQPQTPRYFTSPLPHKPQSANVLYVFENADIANTWIDKNLRKLHPRRYFEVVVSTDANVEHLAKDLLRMPICNIGEWSIDHS